MVEFLHACWHTIKHDFVDVFQHLYEQHGRGFSCLNQTKCYSSYCRSMPMREPCVITGPQSDSPNCKTLCQGSSARPRPKVRWPSEPNSDPVHLEAQLAQQFWPGTTIRPPTASADAGLVLCSHYLSQYICSRSYA
jgi:hypothetical protein